MREGREVCCDSEAPSLGSCCGSEKCDEIGKIREICIKQVNYGYMLVVTHLLLNLLLNLVKC